MICPRCREQGRKSIIRGGMGSVTAMYCPPYYDEEGLFHSHDQNVSVLTYTCSNGHRITVKATGKCPSCSWGHDNEFISVEDMGSQTLITDGSGLVKISNE
jgi:hypothetical protein